MTQAASENTSSDSENRWIIFDADNTLWNVEAFYNSARTEMAEYVATLCDSPSHDIESYQQERDRQLSDIYGYSASRFARSFEDTIYKFVPKATSEHVRHVRALAEAVFTQKADLTPDVELVLRSLRSQGWYLGLLTAGESWVQQKRISEFHLQGIFHAIEVVEQKTALEFKKFCEKHNVEPDKCWVVGDSKRSDIDPAISAGLHAILVPHENWAVVENTTDVDGSKFTAVEHLREVLNVVGAHAAEFRPAGRAQIDCYGIFEGGGAKGLAHVGALKACEERKIRFKGIAGTSAGAIIAGLIAVGYEAQELFSAEVNDGHRVFDQDYISLVGRQEWDRAQGILGKADRVTAQLEKIYSDAGSGATIPFIGWPQSAWRAGKAVFYWLQLGRALRPLVPVATELGYFSLSGFQHWYNKQLAHKLLRKADEIITFADIDFDLRIISADLRSSTIIVHSKETCPGRSVAEAVAASVCIPLVFKPKTFADAENAELHVDGGMLSNFPAWVFASQDPLPVLGFELVDQSAILPPTPTLFSFLRALVATAISGKKDLEIRGIQNMHFIPIPVSASTLQFDTTYEMRQKTYSEGLGAASKFFPTCLQLVPQEQMAPFLYEAHERIMLHLGRRVHLRLNVMDKNSLGRLSIRYRYNMDLDPDDRMDLPITAGGAGQCFTSRKPIIVDLYRAKREYPRFRMSKYEQALVRSSLRSLLSVPIFDPQSRGDPANRPVMGVLNLDSDDLTADEIGDLEDLAMEISSMISYVWLELAEHGEVKDGT
jgi:predicted acylesterase/phospholipase RssA/FMN phosphatase YigB (HAD superfamily)